MLRVIGVPVFLSVDVVAGGGGIDIVVLLVIVWGCGIYVGDDVVDACCGYVDRGGGDHCRGVDGVVVGCCVVDVVCVVGGVGVVVVVGGGNECNTTGIDMTTATTQRQHQQQKQKQDKQQ